MIKRTSTTFSNFPLIFTRYFCAYFFTRYRRTPQFYIFHFTFYIPPLAAPPARYLSCAFARICAHLRAFLVFFRLFLNLFRRRRTPPPLCLCASVAMSLFQIFHFFSHFLEFFHPP